MCFMLHLFLALQSTAQAPRHALDLLLALPSIGVSTFINGQVDAKL